VPAFDVSNSSRLRWSIFNQKIVKPVGNPNSIHTPTFRTIVNIPTIFMLPINKIAAFHYASHSFATATRTEDREAREATKVA
jgi:hypothetical protein